MPEFVVEVYRDWREYGEITVEAGSNISARMVANAALEAGSKDIEWDGIANTERVRNSEGVEKVTPAAPSNEKQDG